MFRYFGTKVVHSWIAPSVHVFKIFTKRWVSEFSHKKGGVGKIRGIVLKMGDHLFSPQSTLSIVIVIFLNISCACLCVSFI